MKISTLIICFFILFTCLPSAAQEPAIWQFTDEEGLSSMTVYRVIQDHKGYIWLGTARGLCRFDGRHFTNIELPGLLDHEIIAVHEDSFGRIWFNNLSGQIGWVKNGQMHLLELDNDAHLDMRFDLQDSILLLNHLHSSYTSSYWRITLGPEDGVFKKKQLKGAIIQTLVDLVKYGQKWYSKSIAYSKNKLKLFIVNNDRVKHQVLYAQLPKHTPNTNNYILQYVINDSTFYLADFHRLYYYRGRQKLEPLLEDLDYKINRSVRINGELWVLTNNGILTISMQTNRLERTLLKGHNINDVFQDKENNIWISTTGDGIFLIPNLKMEVYTADNSLMQNNNVFSLLHHSDQSLYIGLSGGYMAKLHPDERQSASIKLPWRGRVMSVAENSDELLWVGLDDGICAFYPKSGTSKRLLAPSSIKVIKKGGNDDLWLGTAIYVVKIDKVTERLNREDAFLLKNTSNKRIVRFRTYGLHKDFRERMWLGTTKGIYVYEKEQLSLLFGERDDPVYSVSAITQSADSSIWVATSGEGLLRIKKEQIINKYSTSNGLASDNCRSLYVNQNHLFIGTDNGLNILDVEQGEMTQVDLSDGLPSKEINAVVSVGNSVWLGTPKGLVAFDRNDIRKNTIPPNVWLSGVAINGKDTAIIDNYELPHWKNTIDLQYEGLVYRAKGKETYLYRLLGLDEQWNRTNSRLARFHTLAPGEYEFQVKAINEDGLMSAVPAVQKFRIKTPWWKTTWFYIALALSLMSISAGIVYWRQKDVRKREKIESELNDRIQLLRTEALRTQMNPHFIYNALNAIQDFFITNDQDSALFYLSKFARMIRLIFDYSSRESITFEDELEFLQLYLDLEKLRFGDRVDINFKVEEDFAARIGGLEIPPLLIQPIIENVFKHGLMHKLGGGKLDIYFEQHESGRIKCVVQDNGVGRDVAASLQKWKGKKRKFSGLEATRERIKMWHPGELKEERFVITDLKDTSGNPIGTKVELLI